MQGNRFARSDFRIGEIRHACADRDFRPRRAPGKTGKNGPNNLLLLKGQREVVQDSSSSAPDSVALAGRWVNESGTVMNLNVRGDGGITGTVRFSTDGAVYRPYTLQGTTVDRDGSWGLVAAVNGWPHQGALTVWCGELSSNGEELSFTLLQAAGPTSIDLDQAIGGATFRRLAERRPERTA